MQSALTIKGKSFVHPDGTVVILQKIPTSKLKGIVKARRPVSLSDMDTAIAESAISGRPLKAS